MQTSEFSNVQSCEDLFVQLAQEMFIAASTAVPAKKQYETIISKAFARFNRIAHTAGAADIRENWFFSNLAVLSSDVSNLTNKKTKTFHDDVVELVWNCVRATQSKYELRFGDKKKQ